MTGTGSNSGLLQTAMSLDLLMVQVGTPILQVCQWANVATKDQSPVSTLFMPDTLHSVTNLSSIDPWFMQFNIRQCLTSMMNFQSKVLFIVKGLLFIVSISYVLFIFCS